MIACLGFSTTVLCAETISSEGEPITIYITGSTLPTNQDRTIHATKIITKDEIEELNPRSVPQLLQTINGLHLENTGSRGGLSAVYLRGSEPNYTAVLIDGVKVNDPTNSRGGAFDFSLLDVGTVERIEIVKGPVSSIYGSAAMAGVINIITSKPTGKEQVSLSLKSGSRGYRGYGLAIGSATNASRLSVNAGYHNDGEQVEGNRFSSASANINGETWLNEHTTKLAVNGFHQQARAESFPDASGGAEYAVIREREQRDITQQQLGVEGQHILSNATRVKLRMSHFQIAESTDSPGVAAGVGGAIPPSVTASDYRRQQVSLTATTTRAKWDASVGLEKQWETGRSDGTLDVGFPLPTNFKLKRQLAAAFAEFQYRVTDQLQAFGGVRLDAPDSFDNETSPRLGVSYFLQQSTLRFSWSEGFKLPGFFALGHPLVGDPDFEPETSESYELSLAHALNATVNLEVAVFDNRFFDLIDYDAVAQSLVQRTEVTTKGIEIAVNYQYAPDIAVVFNVTALDLEVIDSDAELAKRPERMANVMVNWQWTPKINVSGLVRYTGSVTDSANPTGTQILDSYTVLDLSMGWNIDNAWRAQFAVDNVFDEEYEQAVGVVSSGIGVRASVQGSF